MVKPIVKAPRYVIYFKTPQHTRAHWDKSVDAALALLIHGVEYSTMNEWWFRFELMTSYHTGCGTMSKNQLNQEFKLIVEVSGYVIYSNIWSILI